MKARLKHTRAKYWQWGNLYLVPTIRIAWDSEKRKYIDFVWLFVNIEVEI